MPVERVLLLWRSSAAAGADGGSRALCCAGGMSADTKQRFLKQGVDCHEIYELQVGQQGAAAGAPNLPARRAL